MLTHGVYRFLYLSRLASEGGTGVVPGILRHSRQHNNRAGLTGALLFDGSRFCQLIEGEAAEVQPLAERILADPRHDHVRVLCAGPEPSGARRFKGWRTGYADPDLFDAVPEGEAAVDWLAAAMVRCDMD